MSKYKPLAKAIVIETLSGLVAGAATIWVVGFALLVIGCKTSGYCGG